MPNSEYDNVHFFEEYAKMFRSQQGLPGAGEWRQFQQLFPDLQGKSVLDLGCGSGILSIAALVLGAREAFACDIDEKCVDVAYENAALNGIGKDRYAVLVGDVLSNGALREALGGGYDVVVANIVADVIIGLAPMVQQFLKPAERAEKAADEPSQQHPQ